MAPANHPQAAASPTAAPARKAGSPLLKIVVVLVGFVLLLGMAGVGGVVYVVHLAKKKAAQFERRYDPHKTAPAAGGLSRGNGSAGSNNSGAAQNQKDGGSATPPDTGPDLPAGALPTSFAPTEPAVATPIVVTGEEKKQWALKYERTEGGPEADLVVRAGDINNLGFDWDPGFDPFSGKSTQPHFFPWTPRPDEPDGTDRVMIASIVTAADVYARAGHDGYRTHDGYSETLLKPCCAVPQPNAPPNQARLDSMPRPVTLTLGALPAKIDAVVVQIFVDDFQPTYLHSHFQVTLNGSRIPPLEDAINALNQTGPIGKLLTLELLPEYWPLLQSGTVKLFIDDPTTHVPDGYAIDFVRILVNPHPFKYQVSLAASVVDADQHTPIAGATVSAGLASQSTDSLGQCQLGGLAAGLVVVTAIAPGYDANSKPVDLVVGQTGRVVLPLHHHNEGTDALERAVEQTGSAKIYGIHFDTDSAKLRADSAPALAALLGLLNNHPGSRWLIEGHTDNEGSEGHNQTLSEARAASVVSWLTTNGVSTSLLVPQGFGATEPVADNATANGRALNRRVEVAPAK